MTLTVNNSVVTNTASAEKYSLLKNKEHDSFKISNEENQSLTQNTTRNDKTADTIEISHKKKNDSYKDPLLKWPLRGLAFSSDIGVAIMDIAPNAGLALWIPTLMYLGADVYDKYKTEEKEYQPSGKRAFKQAMFQACASVALPFVAIHNGQKAASWIGRSTTKEKMSLQLKEEVDQFTINMLSRRKLSDYKDNIQGFKTEFNEQMKLHLVDMENSRKTKNPFKLLFRWVFGSKHGEKLDEKTLKKVEEYSNKNIDEMFEIRTSLLTDKKSEKISDKLLKLFDTQKYSFATDKKAIEAPVESAVKEVLKQRQKNRLFKTKIWKSVGGFVALGASIKFIDKFSEEFLLEKVIEPSIDNFQVKREFAKFTNKQNA